MKIRNFSIFAILPLLFFSLAAIAAEDKDLSIAAAALHDRMLDIAKTHAEKVADDQSRPIAVRKKALCLLLEILGKSGDANALSTVVNRAVAEQLLDSDDTETITLLAETALKCSDAQLAIEYAASATNRNDVALLRILARAERKKGDLDKALYNYRCAAMHATGDAAAENAIEWAEALRDGNRPEEALFLLESRSDITNTPAAMYMRADLYRKAGKLEKAIADFNAVCAITNSSPRLTALSLLELSGLEQDPVRAGEYAEKALNIAPDAPLKLAAEFRHGKILLSQTNTLDRGIALLKTTIRRHPDAKHAEDSQLAIADALLKSGDSKRAAGEYRIFLESYPKSPLIAVALENRGIALLQSGKASEAIQSFRRAASIFGNGPFYSKCMMLLGDAHTAAGQFQEAASVYGEIAVQDTDPETVALALFRSADAMERTGEKEKAAKTFESVPARYPESKLAESAKFRTANLKAQNGDVRGAAAIYSELLDGSTNREFRTSVHMARGRMHYRQFRHADALQDFAAVAEISDRMRDEARFLSILCLYGMGRDIQARTAAENMLASDPASTRTPDTILWLGKYFFNRSDWKNARKYFSEYVTRWPGGKRVHTAWYWAAKSAFNANDFSGCIELISELRKAAPESERASDALMLQANALIELARFDEAMLLLDRIIVQSPGTPAARDALLRKSDCLFTMGSGNVTSYEEAMKTYRKCVKESNPTEPELLKLNFKIARCLEKMGREAEAVDQYYTGVMLRYGENRENRIRMGEESASLFVRAGFAAAQLCSKRGEPERAIAILKRISNAGVPGSKEAEIRIKALHDRKPEEL